MDNSEAWDSWTPQEQRRVNPDMEEPRKSKGTKDVMGAPLVSDPMVLTQEHLGCFGRPCLCSQLLGSVLLPTHSLLRSLISHSNSTGLLGTQLRSDSSSLASL